MSARRAAAASGGSIGELVTLGRLATARSGAAILAVREGDPASEGGGAGRVRRVVVVGGNVRSPREGEGASEPPSDACEVECSSSAAVDVIDVYTGEPARSVVARGRPLLRARESAALGLWRGRVFAAGGIADHG